MSDAKPDPAFPPRGYLAFPLGAVSGLVMGTMGCFIVPRSGSVYSGWYILAAWVLLSALWTAYFPTRRTRALFVAGSIIGLVVPLGGLLLLILMMPPAAGAPG